MGDDLSVLYGLVVVQAVVQCSCYYPFYFNALKCYPIPTPGVSLHNTPPIILVIIGDIPPGGIFWKKNPGLTSTHHCTKACPLFHRVFHICTRQAKHMDCTTTLCCIYPLYTVNTVNTTIQPPQPSAAPTTQPPNLFPLFNPLYLLI